MLCNGHRFNPGSSWCIHWTSWWSEWAKSIKFVIVNGNQWQQKEALVNIFTDSGFPTRKIWWFQNPQIFFLLEPKFKITRCCTSESPDQCKDEKKQSKEKQKGMTKMYQTLRTGTQCIHKNINEKKNITVQLTNKKIVTFSRHVESLL